MIPLGSDGVFELITTFLLTESGSYADAWVLVRGRSHPKFHELQVGVNDFIINNKKKKQKWPWMLGRQKQYMSNRIRLWGIYHPHQFFSQYIEVEKLFHLILCNYAIYKGPNFHSHPSRRKTAEILNGFSKPPDRWSQAGQASSNTSSLRGPQLHRISVFCWSETVNIPTWTPLAVDLVLACGSLLRVTALQMGPRQILAWGQCLPRRRSGNLRSAPTLSN